MKCWSGIFPTTLTYVVMLENYWNNISMYRCFPIQGARFKIVMKFNEARISEWNLMNYKGVCRTAPVTPGLLNTLCLLVKFHQGGFASNWDTPSSFLIINVMITFYKFLLTSDVQLFMSLCLKYYFIENFLVTNI